MAKLKIFENDDTTQQIPSRDGYRNVARNCLADLANFRAASDTARSDMLQTYAAGPTIFQLTRGSPEQNEAIDSNNCKIKIRNDERRSGGSYGKHQLVLPEIISGDPALGVTYLNRYAEAVASLYGSGTNQEVVRACEFLFGIMLLTRCR